MTKDTFILLTGEEPEDVLGADWQNEIEDWSELDIPTYMREDERERVADEHIGAEILLEHSADPDDPDYPENMSDWI